MSPTLLASDGVVFASAAPAPIAAWLASLLLFLVAAFVFFRRRLRKLRRDRAQLDATIATLTADLAIARAAASEADRVKNAFLAGMSHELRTPLNGVIGYAQVLQKSPDIVARDRERLRIVQSSGEQLLRMIDQVLDFSKLETGRLEPCTAPFNLPQLLHEIARTFETRALEQQLHFSAEIGADLCPNVIGDAPKLRQILEHLLGNSFKFTARGAVVLRAIPTGARVSFAIEDTGVGLSLAQQATLFRPLDSSATKLSSQPGPGLGLAIAHRLVALMGGALTVESISGSGSTFSFSLPLAPGPAGPPAPQPAGRPPIGYRGERRRLLVVDDIAVNRSVVVELLQPLGFVLHEAETGEQALAAVESFQPHLIFLDLRMPGMDGIEVARRIRALPPAGVKPILVAMSASVLSLNRDKALEAGCDDFLPKPFREADLIARLATHLDLVWRHGDTAAPFATDAPASAARENDLRRLLEIARRGEIRLLREQLDRLRTAHPDDPRLQQLDTLARDYQMERIRAHLSLFLSTVPSPA